MQRRFFPIVALLLVSACTPVNDFGEYWARGVVDPAVAGTWKKIGVPGEPVDTTPGMDLLIFTHDGPSYAMRAVNLVTAELSADDKVQREKDNAQRSTVRTLRIKNTNFFMVRFDNGTINGMIDRYEIAGDVLREYWLYPAMAEEFLAAKHPAAVNFKRHTEMGYSVSIQTFDEEVVNILSEALDDPTLWILICEYRKTP